MLRKCTKDDVANTPIENLSRQVFEIGNQATLLLEVDALFPNRLLPLVHGEILEYLQELNAVGTSYDARKVHDEAWDIFVFVMSYVRAIGMADELTYISGTINGAAGKSGFPDVLAQTIGDLNTLKKDTLQQQHTREKIYRLLVSMIMHLPNLGTDLGSILNTTTRKVLLNRPGQFYSAYDENGMKLSPDELQDKYGKLEKLMRLRRKSLGRYLNEQDQIVLAPIVARWREPIEVLIQLVNALPRDPILNPRGV